MPKLINPNGERAHWTLKNGVPTKVVDPVRNKKINELSAIYAQDFEAKKGLGVG